MTDLEHQSLQLERGVLTMAAPHCSSSTESSNKLRQIPLDIPYEDDIVDSLLAIPPCPCGVLVILAHGTTGTLHMPQLEVMTRHLVAHGIHCLRYTDHRLELDQKVDVYYAVLKYISYKEKGIKHIYLGGRSLGARAAVGLANKVAGTDIGELVKGVICIAYPLHLIDNRNDLRVLPLLELQYHGLIVNGDQDPYCDKRLMQFQMSSVLTEKCLKLYWIEDADHLFRDTQEKKQDNIERVIKIVVEWCSQHSDIEFVQVDPVQYNIATVSHGSPEYLS